MSIKLILSRQQIDFLDDRHERDLRAIDCYREKRTKISMLLISLEYR